MSVSVSVILPFNFLFKLYITLQLRFSCADISVHMFLCCTSFPQHTLLVKSCLFTVWWMLCTILFFQSYLNAEWFFHLTIPIGLILLPEALKLGFRTFIGEYFRLPDRVKHTYMLYVIWKVVICTYICPSLCPCSCGLAC